MINDIKQTAVKLIEELYPENSNTTLQNPLVLNAVESIITAFVEKDKNKLISSSQIFHELNETTTNTFHNETGFTSIDRINNHFMNQAKSKLVAANRLKSKQLAHQAQLLFNILTEDLQYGIKNISEKKIIAEKNKCHPKDISDNMLEKTADDFMRELILEEEREKKLKIKKQSRRQEKNNNISKASFQVNKKNNNKKNVVQTNKKKAISSETIKNVQGNFLTQLALDLCQSQMKCQELPRVTRWAAKDPDTIRNFRDWDSEGNEVHYYENLSDEQIAEQRAKHYLPGTERLLKSSYRDIYAFPTDRGYGMVAQLEYNGTKQNGVIYFGVTKSHVVFHKYFENIASFKDSKKNFFIDNSPSQIEEKSEEWISKDKFRLEPTKEGQLQFIYKTHNVNIFPLHKES